MVDIVFSFLNVRMMITRTFAWQRLGNFNFIWVCCCILSRELDASLFESVVNMLISSSNWLLTIVISLMTNWFIVDFTVVTWMFWVSFVGNSCEIPLMFQLVSTFCCCKSLNSKLFCISFLVMSVVLGRGVWWVCGDHFLMEKWGRKQFQFCLFFVEYYHGWDCCVK